MKSYAFSVSATMWLAASLVGSVALDGIIHDAPVQAQTPTAPYQILKPEKYDSPFSPALNDLIAFKFMPQLLQTDPNALTFFVALNDCSAAAKKNNEFEWPSVKSFYLEHAEEILRRIKTHIKIKISSDLGQYDVTTGSFPFIAPVIFPEVFVLGHLADNPCTEWNVQGTNNRPYVLQTDRLEFSRFKMPEAAAQKYVQRLNTQFRSVTLYIDVDIASVKLGTGNIKVGSGARSAAESFMARTALGPNSLLFSGRITRVTVIDDSNHAELGTLYEAL